MISCEEMKNIDQYAVEILKVPSIVLMENAAIGFVNSLDFIDFNKIAIFCGVGNNGGDGLAIARQLLIRGKSIHVYIIGDLKRGTKDFRINLEILENLNIPISMITREEELDEIRDGFSTFDVLIDGIFGIGLSRKVEGVFYQVIALINEVNIPVYSIDIPSGINGDTGEVMGIGIFAKETVTFHQMKHGLTKASKHTGIVRIASIGIPIDIPIE